MTALYSELHCAVVLPILYLLTQLDIVKAVLESPTTHNKTTINRPFITGLPRPDGAT